MISFVRALLGVLLLFYIAIIYESTALVFLGFAGLMLILFAFVYLLLVRGQVKGRLHLPISVVDAKRPFYLELQVSMHYPFPVAGVKACILYGEQSDSRKRKCMNALQASRKGCYSLSCRLSVPNAGAYEIILRKIRIYDVTGLFYLEKGMEAKEQVLVLPEPYVIPVTVGERVRNFFGDADSYDDLKPGYDPSETFDVREFRNGDRMQNVHWKLSAKNDDLIVKENSLPKACPVVLFLSMGKAHYREQLVTIASISYSLMDVGCPHFAVWNSKSEKQLLRTRVDNEESFYQFLIAYMQDGTAVEKTLLREEYHRKYRGEAYLYDIFADENAKICLNDSLVTELLLQ